MKIAIIGATAAGLNCALRLRRLDDSLEIKVFEKEDNFATSKCCIPYFLEDKTTYENLEALSPSILKDWYNLEIMTGCKVLKISEKENRLTYFEKSSDSKKEYIYDKLVIASGTRARKLDCENIEKVKNIFKADKIEDAKLIKEQLEIKRKVLLVGGGIIGLEVADALIEKEHRLSIVDINKQLAPMCDYDMSSYVEETLESHGVLLYLGRKVVKFSNDGKKAFLDNGNEISFDLLIYAIGQLPNTDFLKDTKIKLTKDGYIKVNNKFQTNIKNIYAVGDVCENIVFQSKKKRHYSNALVASRDGRKAASIIMGLPFKNEGVIKTGVAKLRNITIAWTGLLEKELEKTEYKTIRLHSPSVTACYKKKQDLKIKVLFQPKTFKILGAQAIGEVGADKFVDVISLAIQNNISVLKLADYEACYAPPYNIVKPAILKVGFIAEDIKYNLTDTTFIPFDKKVNEIENVLDVRDEIELRGFEIEGAVHVPLKELRKNIDKVKDMPQPIKVFCRIGKRAYLAVRILAKHMIKATVIDGGELSIKALKYKKRKGE